MITRKIIYISAILALMTLFIGCGPCFKKIDHNTLTQLINESENSLIKKIRSNKEVYEVQVLYTQIQRDKEGKPGFKEFSYQENPKRYFYPASTCLLYTSPSPRD